MRSRASRRAGRRVDTEDPSGINRSGAQRSDLSARVLNTATTTATTTAAAATVRRLGITPSWWGVLRITAWAVVWVLVIGWIIDPAGPSAGERERIADDPASAVRYLGPTSVGDFAGFVAPAPGDTDDVFTIAFVGGSELKLDRVSVVGEVSRQIASVGGAPTRFDSYTVVAPRPLDALRGLEAAIANGSDAIAVSINAVWLTDEWSMREWPNLDVANAGTLWSDPGSWPWAVALESPADITWRATRAASPTVEAQGRLGRRAQEVVDAIDIVDRVDRSAPTVPPAAPEPHLAGDAATFWLVDAYGPTIMDDTTERVARMVEGFDRDAPGATLFTKRLIDTAEAAGVPVFLYVAPFAPEGADNPRFVAAEQKVADYWAAAAGTVTSSLVEIEPRSMTPSFADEAAFIDIVHMIDAAPFARVLAGRLCTQWITIDPELECAS